MTPEQEDKLNDIHACLVGNKLKGQRGLIDRVDLCENKLDTHEKILEKKANRINWSKIFSLGIKFGTKASGL
ncbi:MAG TPA: hypothetical protein VGD26_11605 [Chitinophagaceae bacterium]